MTLLGWKAGPEQYPPGALLDYAIAAEKAGFDSLDCSDHFHPWSEEGQASFAWTWLGAAAARTSRILLGPGVTCPILRYHPSVIAQASATLAAMAPGRTFLSVGTGEALNDYAATGEWPSYAERQNRLLEAIDLIRALWRGDEVTYRGAFYQTRKARLFTRPPETIPLFVSALVPTSANFAGRVGDGLITVGGKDPVTYSQMIHQFEDGARRAGKSPATMPKMIELNVALTDDTAAAVEQFQRYWAGSFVPALYNQNIYTPRMSEENGSVVGSDAIKRMTCISGNPDEHVQFARSFIDLGFDQLYFHSACHDQREFLERYGRDVLPRIRAIEAGSAARAA